MLTDVPVGSCTTQLYLRMQQVTRQLAAGVVMPVRVTGPVGRTADRALDHPVLLIFAGGVGVSPGTTVTPAYFPGG